MFNFFKKIKARYLFIMFFVMLVVDILLCLLTMKLNNKTLSMIILVVAFLITGSILSNAMYKVFIDKGAKTNKVVHKFKGEEFMKENLKDFTTNVRPFGVVYSKVIDKCAYKVTYVTDYSKYTTEDDNNNYKKTPGVDEAKWMIGFEIFSEMNDDLKRKLPLYSMSGEKLYYLGMYIDNDNIIEADHIEPYTYLKEKYEKLLDILGIYDENVEEDINK
jgi:hypothetical protein